MTTEGKTQNFRLRGPLVEALDEVRAQEGVTEVEALHILVKHGRYLRNAARQPRTRILIERDGVQTEVVFL